MRLNYSSRNRDFPAGNPLANALVVIVGVLAIGFSLVVGFVAFLALGALFLVLGAVVAIRLWWLRRRLERRARQGQGRPRRNGGPGDGVIEGEFRVITRDSERPRR